LTSSSGFTAVLAAQWGNSSLGDKPFQAEIDGDGVADLIVWRPTDGTWYWLTSSTGYAYASAGARQWGNISLGDVPMIGDFDGDGRADLAVWRSPSGTWYWLTSSSGYSYSSAIGRQWGAASDIPMVRSQGLPATSSAVNQSASLVGVERIGESAGSRFDSEAAHRCWAA
jgi:hypothetical protein